MIGKREFTVLLLATALAFGGVVVEASQRPVLAARAYGQEQASRVEALSDASFEGFIASGTVVVDFYADWCGYCRKLAPTFDKVSREMHGKVKFGKVNVDNARTTTKQYGVRSMPTLVLFKNGKEVKRHVGNIDADGLRKFIG